MKLQGWESIPIKLIIYGPGPPGLFKGKPN